MSRSLRLTSFAANRMEEIRIWYQENYGEEMAHDFSVTMLERFELLEEFNEVAPKVFIRPEIRRLVITGRFEFYAFYRLTEKEIIVLALTKNAKLR